MTDKCIVHGCQNHKHQGRFEGDLCAPCYRMLTTGNPKFGTTFVHNMEARILADAKVIDVAKALKDDVLEVQAYRSQCKNGSVNLSALALKMQKVEQSLAAFNEALKAEQEEDDE